jgi:hypothetical protein
MAIIITLIYILGRTYTFLGNFRLFFAVNVLEICIQKSGLFKVFFSVELATLRAKPDVKMDTVKFRVNFLDFWPTEHWTCVQCFFYLVLFYQMQKQGIVIRIKSEWLIVIYLCHILLYCCLGITLSKKKNAKTVSLTKKWEPKLNLWNRTKLD